MHAYFDACSRSPTAAHRDLVARPRAAARPSPRASGCARRTVVPPDELLPDVRRAGRIAAARHLSAQGRRLPNAQAGRRLPLAPGATTRRADDDWSTVHPVPGALTVNTVATWRRRARPPARPRARAPSPSSRLDLHLPRAWSNDRSTRRSIECSTAPTRCATRRRTSTTEGYATTVAPSPTHGAPRRARRLGLLQSAALRRRLCRLRPEIQISDIAAADSWHVANWRARSTRSTSPNSVLARGEPPPPRARGLDRASCRV